MKPETKILKEWLKKNKPSVMAVKLGYGHSTVITNWVNNDSIPTYQLDRVMEIINETPDKSANGKAKKTTSDSSLRS